MLAALALIAWALGDLWLHGGPQARRQAKLDAQRKAQEEASAAPSANPQPATCYVVWQKMVNQGSTSETLTLPSFSGPAKPSFSAPGGLSVQKPLGQYTR